MFAPVFILAVSIFVVHPNFLTTLQVRTLHTEATMETFLKQLNTVTTSREKRSQITVE